MAQFANQKTLAFVTASHRMERALIQQLVEVFAELPDTHIALNRSEPGDATKGSVSARIDLRLAGKSIVLLVEVRKSVYPRDVHQTLWRLKSTQLGHHIEVQHLLAAEELSPGAKALLREERIGYFDSGGSLFLPATGAFILIDKPLPKRAEKSARTLFSGRRAQVLHALLSDRGEWFGVNQVAERAQVAASTASDVLAELEKLDWLASRGSGPGKERQLREPSALLDAWAAQLATQRPPALRRYFVPGLNIDGLILKLGGALDIYRVPYALSHEAAAQCYAPFLSGISQARLRLMPGAEADMALAELGARTVSEGANLAVIDAASSGELLFRQQADGIWLASPVQVYLDLMRSEGRAKEMAEHLRKERIGF